MRMRGKFHLSLSRSAFHVTELSYLKIALQTARRRKTSTINIILDSNEP
jgi:hypothetical protein